MLVFTPSLRDRLVQSAENYVKCRVFKKEDRDLVNSLLRDTKSPVDESAKTELALFAINSIVKEYEFKKLSFKCDKKMENSVFLGQVADILQYTPNVELIEFIDAAFFKFEEGRHARLSEMFRSLKSLTSLRIVGGRADHTLRELLVEVPLTLLELHEVYIGFCEDSAKFACDLVSSNPPIRSLRIIESERQRSNGLPSSLEPLLNALLENTHLEVNVSLLK